MYLQTKEQREEGQEEKLMMKNHNKIFIAGGCSNLPGLVSKIHAELDTWNENITRFKFKGFNSAPKPENAVFRGLSLLVADLHCADFWKVISIKPDNKVHIRVPVDPSIESDSDEEGKKSDDGESSY